MIGSSIEGGNEITNDDDKAKADVEDGLEDDSEAEESISSVDSAAEREAAIRAGFLGVLFGYIQNDLFQRFLEFIDKVVTWVYRKCCKKSAQDDEDHGYSFHWRFPRKLTGAICQSCRRNSSTSAINEISSSLFACT